MATATVMMSGIRVEPDLVDRYRDEAEEQGVSVSELVRRALRTFLDLPAGTPLDTSTEALVRRLVDERLHELGLDNEAA